jgi:hypothetical protein
MREWVPEVMIGKRDHRAAIRDENGRVRWESDTTYREYNEAFRAASAKLADLIG